MALRLRSVLAVHTIRLSHSGPSSHSHLVIRSSLSDWSNPECMLYGLCGIRFGARRCLRFATSDGWNQHCLLADAPHAARLLRCSCMGHALSASVELAGASDAWAITGADQLHLVRCGWLRSHASSRILCSSGYPPLLAASFATRPTS